MTRPLSPTDAPTGERAKDIREARRDTASLIAVSGTTVELWRSPQRVPDGAGGFHPGPGDPGPVSSARRFFSVLAYDPAQHVIRGNTAQGEFLPDRFVLIGPHDDDIREGDWLYFQGQKFNVKFVHPDRTYQVKAEGSVVVE